MKSRKIFWEDSYLQELKSNVIEIKDNYILLDNTIIYSFSGGQVSDKATINNQEVISSYIDDEGNIWYQTQNIESFNVGDEVNLRIDWSFRYNIIKLHSAQHIVGCIAQEIGLVFSNVRGSNVRESKTTLTYEADSISLELLQEIEEQSNNFISQNKEISVSFESENSQKRIWRCGVYEIACGGLHVKNTQEIGAIKLKRKSGGKGREVIEISL